MCGPLRYPPRSSPSLSLSSRRGPGGHARYSASFQAHARSISARGAQCNRAFAGGDEKRALISRTRTLLEELFGKLSKRRELAVAGSVSRWLRVDTQDFILAHLAASAPLFASFEILHDEKFRCEPANLVIFWPMFFFSANSCAIDLRQKARYIYSAVLQSVTLQMCIGVISLNFRQKS